MAYNGLNLNDLKYFYINLEYFPYRQNAQNEGVLS